MLLEDQRGAHEDLERLEAAIADRTTEDPKNIKERLRRDHEINRFLTRAQERSAELVDVYRDRDGGRSREVQSLSTGDPFEAFYRELEKVKDHHRQYPNSAVEDLERGYKRRRLNAEGEIVPSEVDNMFTGEEGNGRFLDLISLHEDYLNLPTVKRLTYLQYLDNFDAFEAPRMPIKRLNKVSDNYLKYVKDLDSYLESFVRRTRPLDDHVKYFTKLDREFDTEWEAGKVPGWPKEDHTKATDAGPQTEGTGSGMWCSDCEKEFSNHNVYKSHLTGKKHIRNSQLRQPSQTNGTTTNGTTALPSTHHLRERAIASHESRIRSLSELLSTTRSNTRVNVERKAGMTERERQTELDSLFAEDDAAAYLHSHTNGDGDNDSGSEDSGDEKIYNPLKLPLAWDGKPIPYWLYKLHGLGVEFPCEICGNFVYMGRRAFDKHFSEARHVYGLKCLGITNTSGSGGVNLFREIVKIEQAVGLWESLKREKGEKERRDEGVVQMEDGEGNVMPERIYLDLQKQGIL